MERIVQLLKALSDETRLKILVILSRRRICAKGLSKHLGISEAAVSQHLRALKDAEIIVGEKIGYYVHYVIQEFRLMEVISLIEELCDHKSSMKCFPEVHLTSDCRENCKSSRNMCCRK
ncbi:MAG: ArsR/SmtB family transcription factor [Bacillota bacterium]